MFSPLALTTPTRLPWWWPLMIVWLLMALWSPAFAGEPDDLEHRAHTLHFSSELPPTSGQWQLVSVDYMLRAVARRPDGGATRMLPLAVLASPRSAWWFGLSGSRSSGARLELRFTMPLDGSAWREPSSAALN